MLAGDSDVVEVYARHLNWSHLRQPAHGKGFFTCRFVGLTLEDIVNTDGGCCLHALVGQPVHQRFHLVLVGHLRIPLVLDFGGRQPIAHTDPLEVNVQSLSLLVTLKNCIGGGRDVMATIAFAKQVEVVLLKTLVGRKEGLEEVVHVPRHLSFIRVIVGIHSKGESSASRLVDENHGGILVPGEGVLLSFKIGLDLARSHLVEESNARRAPWTPSHPQDHRILARLRARLKKPVEIILSGSSDVVVSSILLHIIT
mmetsp:Transcript_27111/g.42402  ORF Transcript_27111/g.42402 Transcript_27111/m.42402 type:complete len:255 (-) Transcript_27111:179-943(-)